jgi:hypothetical protein
VIFLHSGVTFVAHLLCIVIMLHFVLLAFLDLFSLVG